MKTFECTPGGSSKLGDINADLVDAIFHRRAVRHYLDREVDAATVQQLIVAAVQAPSELNRQPWAFGVFHDRKRLHEYSERAKCYLLATVPPSFDGHSRSELYANTDFDLFHGASTLIVIYAQPGGSHPNEDCCLAAQNLMLAAHGLGLGTCPVGFARPWLDCPETKRDLNVPDSYAAVFPLVVGYPSRATTSTPRLEPSIVSWMWDEA